MAKASWNSDWRVGVRVWVERAGKALLGDGKAELMSAIEREHSITKAAKAAGMSYRRAWNMIQEINAAAGEPLVEAAVGGTKGGGAKLTARGRMAVEVFEQVRASLVESAAGALQQSVAFEKGASEAPCVHLSAAISLQEAVGQILAEYALVQPATRVRAIFGASNELADHLLAGAPGDLLISAEAAELDRLEAARLVVGGTRRIVARNGLAVVGTSKLGAVKKAADLLSERVKRVALAEPACPLGQHAKAFLTKAGIYEQLLARVLHVDNSRAVLAAVVSGAADVGVAFSSDAARRGDWKTLFQVSDSKAAVVYAAALVGRGKHDTTQARGLLDFLGTAAAARSLSRCGLQPAKASFPRDGRKAALSKSR